MHLFANWVIVAASSSLPKSVLNLLGVRDLRRTLVPFFILVEEFHGLSPIPWTNTFFILSSLFRPGRYAEQVVWHWNVSLTHARTNLLEWFVLFFLCITERLNACWLNLVLSPVSFSSVYRNRDSKNTKKRKAHPREAAKKLFQVC